MRLAPAPTKGPMEWALLQPYNGPQFRARSKQQTNETEKMVPSQSIRLILDLKSLSRFSRGSLNSKPIIRMDVPPMNRLIQKSHRQVTWSTKAPSIWYEVDILISADWMYVIKVVSRTIAYLSMDRRRWICPKSQPTWTEIVGAIGWVQHGNNASSSKSLHSSPCN